MRSLFASLAVAVGAAFALLPTSCDVPQPDQTTYYERTILPILNTGCVRSPSGAACHASDAKGNALGNLDVTTYAEISKRRDLLINYGPYARPALLVKNIQPFNVTVSNFDGTTTDVTTDIKHTGGPILDPTTTGYLTLSQWMSNGATENNTGVPPPNTTRLPCNDSVPPADPTTGFDPNKDPPDTVAYQNFVSNVINNGSLDTCAAGNCHGTQVNELYLTCGKNSDAEKRWNYHAALQYISPNPATANQSELLKRPLAPSQGGAFHEGGVIWQSTGDSNYQNILTWASSMEAAQAFQNEINTITASQPNFMFYVHRVQPMLVKKGCMMLQCHSAAMFHEYRLRGGTGGSFALPSSQKNYTLTLLQLGLDSDDVNASRIIQKNLHRKDVDPNGGGIEHRGGPLFEDFGATDGVDGGTPQLIEASGALCDSHTPAYNYDTDDINTIPAYCMIREWHRRERAAGTCTGGPCNLAPLSGIVWVQRPNPSGPDSATDFDVFAGGASIHILGASLDAAGNVVTTTDMDVTAGCGLTGADIRRPAVSWDAKQIAFAARPDASTPFSIYTMKPDGSSCVKDPNLNAVTGTSNGLLVHNFDPQYGPPDSNGVSPIVFVSTRGVDPNGPFASNFSYNGTQRQPFDPTKPNPDLFVYEPDPTKPGSFRTRQLTFQLNMERFPSFMHDGRLIFSAVKREPNFYEIALRRLNLDGGDYHPLYSQRGSIGLYEATQVVELANKNFATIFSMPGWQHNGGVLGVFNRSIGIDFYSTNKNDYPIDPSAFDPNSMSSPEQQFFLHSLEFVDGKGVFNTENGAPVGSLSPSSYTGGGIYRSPAPLPNGKILVSFSSATNPASFDMTTYGLYVIDPVAQNLTPIAGANGGAVDAVPIYGRYNLGTFVSATDEPNGNTSVDPTKTDAQIFVLDFSVLGSLLFQNTPTGRAVESVDAQGNDVGLDSFEVYEEMPPDSTVTSFGAGGSNVAMDTFGQVYVKRRLLGSVSLQSDKSTYFSIPGGVPIVLHLPDTTVSKTNGYPRWQKEEMSFYPGERSHQSFQATFFNGLCALCHGSISGRPLDAAVNPDLLTQASQVQAAGQTGSNNYNVPQNLRAMPIGPPSGN